MRNKTKSQVLVVDDEVLICESIKSLLVSRGYEVHTERSVKGSVELAEKLAFDIVLIDKNLPEEDGFVLMDYMLANQPHVPLIMMTGNASIDSAILALRKGAYDYLRKPFKYEELINVVSHALTQKKLEDENRLITAMLNNSERRYREMIQNSPDLIIMLDRYGCISFVNTTVISMLGYSIEELKGVPLINIIDEKYRESVLSFLALPSVNQERRQEGKCVSPQETDILAPLSHQEGSDCGVDVKILCSPGFAFEKKTIDIEIKKSSFSFNNTCYGKSPAEEICIVGRDICFRKSFEQQMIYSQKMEAVAVLAGGVAHDFNNLLMGIQGYTTAIKSSFDIEHPCYKKLVSIEKSVAKGSGLISQLLNFSRGGLSDMQSANINFAIKETLELFSINRKNIQIHLDLCKDIRKVQVDVGQMEQVFLNLFINAHHAMKKGGDLFIKTENITVNSVDSKKSKIKPGEYVKISIRDTGHGIDEVHQKKIFDPFFSTKKRSEGTGLGLASVYGIIKKHNGIIKVSSSPGEGALFTIYLCAQTGTGCTELESNLKKEVETANRIPVEITGRSSVALADKITVESEVETANRIPVEITGRSSVALADKITVESVDRMPVRLSTTDKKMTALIIDDEPFVQDATVGMLKSAGINTIVSSNGREGVQKYMEYLDKIDFVVLDMVMPGMGGFETFRYIRKLNPDARILITSCYSHGSEVTRMLSEGRCDFLNKPYNENIFYDRLGSILTMKLSAASGGLS